MHLFIQKYLILYIAQNIMIHNLVYKMTKLNLKREDNLLRKREFHTTDGKTIPRKDHKRDSGI